MAALDDEDMPVYGSGIAASSPYDTIAVPPPPQQQSALGDGGDYGGGEEQQAPISSQVLQLLAKRGLRTPAPEGSAREMMQKVAREQLANYQQQQAQPAKQTYGGFDAQASQGQFDPNTELVPDLPPPEKKKEEEGYGQALVRGFLRAGENAKATADVLKSQKPKTSKVEEAEFEKPFELKDVKDPALLTKKMIFGLSKSAPELAGMILGGTVGTAVGGPVGGVVGAATGTGGVAAIQAIGTAYAHELEKIKDNPTPEAIDKAWSNAQIEAAKASGVSAASVAFFIVGKPLGSALKNMMTKSVVDAAGKTVAKTAGIPLQVGVQAVGQPAISVGGQVAGNVAEGKPIGEGVPEAAVSAIPNIAFDAAGRAIHRGLSGRQPTPEVTPGVTQEQQLALGQQGELPLPPGTGTRPPPIDPSGQMNLPLVGGAGERPPVQGEQMRLPDITGPGRQPLGDQTYTPPTAPPVQPELPGFEPPTPGAPVRGPQTELPLQGGAETPARMIGGQRIPEGAPFVDDGATSIGAAARPIGRVGPEPAEVTPEVTDLALQPDLFRTPTGEVRGPQMGLPGTEDVSVGGTRVPMNAPVLETARRAERDTGARSPIGRLTEPETQQDRRPTQEEGQQDLLGLKTAEGWTFERDHTGPGYVVKNADGNVISVGDSQEQALRFARERHPDQVAATAAPRMTEEPAAQPAGRQINQGTGPTLREAEAAVTRRGGVTEEVPAEEAKPAVTGTKEQLVSAEEKAPPAEAAKVEPAASGRDAVPETPKAETPTAPVKLNREQIIQRLTELGASKAEISSARRKNIVNARNDLAGKEASVAKTAEVKAKALKAGEAAEQIIADRKAEAEARVKRVTDKAKQRAEARVTKPAEELRTETETETEGATTRTKAGAFTMGEGEEMPARAAPAQPSKQPSKMQTGARKESRDHTKLTPTSGQIARVSQHIELTRNPLAVTPGLESTRRAQSIVQHILERGMDLARAIKEFGERKPGTPGPKPNVEKLSQYIRQELEAVETTDAAADIRTTLNTTAERLAKTSKESRTTTPELQAASAAASARIERILDSLTKQLEHYQRVSNERARLTEILPQIEALERGEKIKGVESYATPRSARTAEAMSKLGAVNEPILQHVERAGEAGASLHKILDDFIANSIAAHATPQMTELAQILRRVIPETKVRQGEGRIDNRAVGLYDPVAREIYVDTKAARADGSGAVTLLHETVHRGTLDYITHLYETPEVLLTPREFAHKTALESIRSEVSRVLDEGNLSRSFAEAEGLEYALREYDADNVRGPHELATQLLTQPEVYNILSRETASHRFRQALDNVGMGISSKASIWDGFKRIVRSIFGVPERLDSVLDYAMRPLTEVLETGAKFRPEHLTEARTIARNNFDVIGPESQRTAASMKRIKDAAKNFADPKGRLLLRGAFQGGNLQAIHDMLKPYIPSVTAHRDAIDRVKNASDAEAVRQITTYDNNGQPITESAMDKTNRLSNQLRESPDVREISNLMSEVQYAGMSVIDPARNAHLTTPEQLREQAALQRRFDDLPQAAQQIYREHNALRDEWHRADREAKIEEFVETTFEESTPAERLAIKNQMRTRQGILDVIDRAEATPIGPLLGNKAALAKVFAESQRLGFVDGDYFGLRRNGEYIVSYGDPKVPSSYGVEHFETVTAAQTRKDELHRGNVEKGIPKRTDVSQVFTKSQMQSNKLFQNPAQALGTLDRALETGGITGDRAEIIKDLYATQLIQQGIRAATHTMRREGIRGATEDYARTLMGDYLAHNARMGHLKHGVEVNRTLFQAEHENQQFRHSGASELEVALAETGVRELRKRQIPADGDTSADMIGNGSRALTSWTVASSLIRPAHFFMNTAGAHSAASGLMAGRHGVVASNYAVAKAMAQMTGTTLGVFRRDAWAAIKNEMGAVNWDTLKFYRERMRNAGDISPENADLVADMLDRTNMVNQSRTREMRRMAGPQGYMAGHSYIARAMDVFSAGEHAADSSMRFAIAKAAFVTEFNKNGHNAAEALKYSEQIARDSMPDYNQKSRLATPQGTLGKLAPVTTQFRQFGLHMLGVQANLIAKSLRDANPEIRSQARKSLALLHMQHMLWTGVGGAVFGSLPMMAGLGLWDFLHGEDPHTNREWEVQSRNIAKDIAGKGVADVIAYGLPMAAGIDTHRSLQFTNLLGVPEWRTHDKEGTLSFAIQMLGPSADNAAGMAASVFNMMKGDFRPETVAKLMPRIVRDPIEAYQWGTEGLKTAKGDLTIARPEQFSTAELIAKAAGFIPKTASDARNVRATIDVVNKVSDAAKRAILDEFIRTPAADRKSVMDKIYRYNSIAEPAERITGQAIQARIREQAIINAQPNLAGMRGVSRREVPLMENWTRFARQ